MVLLKKIDYYGALCYTRLHGGGFMEIWENIKRIRKEKGITQQNLADLIGKGKSTVQKYELGITCPPLDVIRKICVALDCDFHDIVQSDPPHQSTQESRRQVEKLMGQESGYLDAPIPTEQEETEKRVQRVRAAFDAMSQDGQEEATRRVEELSRLPEYQKKESPSLSSLWGFDRRGKDAVDPKENE